MAKANRRSQEKNFVDKLYDKYGPIKSLAIISAFGFGGWGFALGIADYFDLLETNLGIYDGKTLPSTKVSNFTANDTYKNGTQYRR